MKTIVILPAAGCRRSKKVLSYLDENQVPYTRIDLETAEGQALSEEHELRSSPGILVDGELVNPFDILEVPSCRIKGPIAREVFGLGDAS
jgi:glutaredoxin